MTADIIQYPEAIDTIRRQNALLAEIVPPEISHEIDDLRAEGYDVTVGCTPEAAYENPDGVREVFEMLDQGGEEFARNMGRFDLGYKAVMTRVRFAAPLKMARNWAKERLMRRNAFAETQRSRILYDRVNIQGQPWHDQNGKALALGTIVDAHDLSVVGRRDGRFPTMSGRLEMDTENFRFSEESGWLNGMTIEEAIVASSQRFKKSSVEKAHIEADEELSKLNEFLTAPVMPGFKEVVANCTDSLGIRSRKEEVRQEINRYADTRDDDSEMLMMSVGCGTALPILEVMKDLRDKGRETHMILVDQDPIALAAAIHYAEQMGLKDNVEVHCEQLFVGKGRKTKVFDLQNILRGRELDVCEDSGLREYFPDFLYKDLTTQAWNALRTGGIMTTGNMNMHRPQPEFLHGLMGWPIDVTMRKMSKIAKLHRDSGVPRQATRFRVTQDGVYTLAFSIKQ